jgi:hypothetical protein
MMREEIMRDFETTTTYSSQWKQNFSFIGVVLNVVRRDEGVVVGIPEGLLLLIIGV